jgi:mono/diheme cytochrome c family protein
MFLSSLLFAVVAAMAACQSQQPSGGRRVSPPAGDKGKAASLATYEDDIQPLLKQKCLSCHSGDQKPDLSSYDLAKKWADDIYKEVKAGTMPTAKKDRLSDAQVATVKSWIDGGHRKTASGSKDDTSAGLVSWDSWVKGYLTKSCLTCHGSGSNSGDYSTFAKASAAAVDILESMEDGRMPKGGTADTAAIKKMKQWVEAGAPQSDRDSGDDDKDDDKNDDKDDDQSAAVTYEGNVKRIINSYCISCHSVGGGISPELDSKSKVVAAADEVYDSVQAGRMPRTGPLGATDKETLKKWIDSGKK